MFTFLSYVVVFLAGVVGGFALHKHRAEIKAKAAAELKERVSKFL